MSKPIRTTTCTPADVDLDDLDTDQPENLAELEKGVMVWACGCLATVVLILGVLVWVLMAGRYGLH